MPSIEDIEEACQALKEGPQGPEKDYMDSFRKFADFWDNMKDHDLYGLKLFGQSKLNVNEVDLISEVSEEDLIFRKLTGIDEFFDRGKIR